jgi:histidinol-phosphatase (PHP family)
MILANGGRFALSDDSHGPHAVGLNYDRMFKYLRRHGLEEIWYLQTSTKRNAAGRLVQPAKFEGEWWTHPFWTAREGIQEL